MTGVAEPRFRRARHQGRCNIPAASGVSSTAGHEMSGPDRDRDDDTRPAQRQVVGWGLGWSRRMRTMSGLVRPRNDRMLGGVASGLAYRFGLPVWLVRLFWLILFLPGGLP